MLGEDTVGVIWITVATPDGRGHRRGLALIQILDSYTEVSPSGTGVHVICNGTLPDGRHHTPGMEMYSDSRYFTVTGAHVPGTRQRSENVPQNSLRPREGLRDRAATRRHHRHRHLGRPDRDPGRCRVAGQGQHCERTAPRSRRCGLAILRPITVTIRGRPRAREHARRSGPGEMRHVWIGCSVRSGLMRAKWDSRRANRRMAPSRLPGRFATVARRSHRRAIPSSWRHEPRRRPRGSRLRPGRRWPTTP